MLALVQLKTLGMSMAIKALIEGSKTAILIRACNMHGVVSGCCSTGSLTTLTRAHDRVRISKGKPDAIVVSPGALKMDCKSLLNSPTLPARKKGTPMANSTRRTVLQLGSAAGATLLALNLSKLAIAQTDSASVFHVFAFQWKPGTSEVQKERARKNILAFQGVIPGLLQTHVGPNISPRGKGYTFGGIMQFKDEASLDAYVHHPAHESLLLWLVPLIDAVELDLRA